MPNSLISPPQTSSLTLEEIKRNLPSEGLFEDKSWLLSSSPLVLTKKFHKELEQLGHRLMKLQNACNLLYQQSVKGKQPDWIAGYLDAGKPEWLIEYSRESALRDKIPQVIRPDILLGDGTYAISELDSVPGGMGLTAWLNQLYSRHGFPVIGGESGMLDGFASIMPKGGDIYVSAESATYRPEMEWLAEQLNQRNGDPGSPGWQVRDTSTAHPGHDAYRFFEMFDLPNVRCSEDLFNRAIRGELNLTPPPKPYLEEKLWFGLFWMKPLESFWERELGGRYYKDLRNAIPYTWIINPDPLPHHAVIPRLEIQSWGELKSMSQKERNLILKVSGFSEKAWGSRGVLLGQDMPQDAWAEAVDTAIAESKVTPRILQEFRKTSTLKHPHFEPDTGKEILMDGRIRLCPYYFTDGQNVSLQGVLATICPPDKKIIHGMQDAILCPCAMER